MISMLQNLLHYTGDYMSKENSLLTSTKYPDQNPDFLNKVIFLPYVNEDDCATNYRLPVSKKQFPQFDGHKGPYENYTRVLRFDLDEPYVCITVDVMNSIIVTDTREVLNYTVYPRYRYNRFRGFDEAILPMTSNWDEFNAEYNSERLRIVHAQDKEYLGREVYVEYFADLFTMEHGESILQPDPRQPETNRRGQDYLDNVYRAREKGYIIRADESGSEAEIVVMIIDENTGDKKYVLGSEAYFYIDVEDHNRIDLSELGLWQLE